MTTRRSTAPSQRTKLGRNPKRAVYDRETIHAILDEAMLCHLGIALPHGPCVLPTIHTRIDDRLYLHGANTNRMFQHLADGGEACITVTILDGLVLARSALHHSMNYRSVVLFAKGSKVASNEEKHEALKALVEQIIPGRWNDSRQPNSKELDATNVISFPIDEASAKIRQGPPIDDAQDQRLPHWAGVIPVALGTGHPVTDDAGLEVPLPDYVAKYDKIPRSISAPLAAV